MPKLTMLSPRIGQANLDRARPAPTKREFHHHLYGRAWRKARLEHLAEHPLCVDCSAEGRTVEATIVDHEQPHDGDEAKFWDRDNWRSRCKPCHDRKTASRDGGFGNPIIA